jgi:hypothetical protein
MSRSQSRGREGLISSGRGGAGNIRPASREPAVARGKGPDDLSPSRGRELPVIGDSFTHSGKGGAGNVRTPSRDAAGERKYVEGVEKYAREHHDPNAPISTGIGGYGNVTRSPAASRSPSRTQDSNRTSLHTFGHGGAGNVAVGDVHGDGNLTIQEEQEVREHHQENAVHSSGRGGAANIGALASPNQKVENAEIHQHHHQPHHHSSGRGGAGNIS